MPRSRLSRALRRTLALSILACGATWAPAGADDAEVRVVGVRVVASTPEGFSGPFNAQPGTSVAALLSYPSGGLIAFDEDASRIDSVADDQGTDLLPDGVSFSEGFGHFPRIADDGTGFLFEIEVSPQPASKAREVRAKGALVMTVGSQTETHRSKAIELEVDAVIEVGPVPFRLTAFGEPEWGDAPLSITLIADQDIDEVAAFRFFDGAGEPIEADDGSSGRMEMMGKVMVERSFTFSREVKAVMVEIDYWKDLQTLEIPFDLRATLGL